MDCLLHAQATDNNDMSLPLQDLTDSVQRREEPSQQREPKQREPATLPPPILSAPRHSSCTHCSPERLVMDPLHKTYLVQVHSTTKSSSDSPHCIQQMPSHLPTAMFGYLSEPFLPSSSSSPQAMKAMLSDPDTLSFDQAMQGEDKDKWLDAAQSEISQVTKKGMWQEVPQSKVTTKIIPGMWVFHHKQHPDGMVKKCKARYCIRGDLQEGEFEIYSPVVSWATIRICLILALTLSWQMACVDFSNTFVQVNLKDKVWIHIPHGFTSTNTTNPMCLLLHKSLYGLSVAPQLWYEKLCQALIDDSFCPANTTIVCSLKRIC